MDCHTFKGLLHEYLDGALDAGVQEAASEHLRRCDVCRQAFLREKALANSIRQSLEQATARLSVRPGMRLGVLEALESKPSPLGAWRDAWRRFVAIRPAGAVAAVMGVVLFLLCIQFYRRSPDHAAHRVVAVSGRSTCIVNVPIPAQAHVFRLQDNAVVDTIVDESAIADARLSEGSEQSPAKP
jgi:anti-sigma factor RsiW